MGDFSIPPSGHIPFYPSPASSADRPEQTDGPSFNERLRVDSPAEADDTRAVPDVREIAPLHELLGVSPEACRARIDELGGPAMHAARMAAIRNLSAGRDMLPAELHDPATDPLTLANAAQAAGHVSPLAAEPRLELERRTRAFKHTLEGITGGSLMGGESTGQGQRGQNDAHQGEQDEGEPGEGSAAGPAGS